LGTTPADIDPATVLFGSTRRRVLAWLLGHADEAYYLRELARHIGGAVGAVQRELELLTACGLVRREVRGKQVYFQANHDAAIFPELRGLFAKTSGLVDILRDALMPLADRIDAAFVFDSAARGELQASSDIDLMVIGDTSFGDVITAVQGAEKRLGRDVTPTVYSVDEFREKIEAKHHFLTTVLAEPKLFVLGDEDGLPSASAKRRHEQGAVRSKRPRTSQTERHRTHRG
jgi:DNA-binding transcriptional ArsR family regulator